MTILTVFDNPPTRTDKVRKKNGSAVAADSIDGRRIVLHRAKVHLRARDLPCQSVGAMPFLRQSAGTCWFLSILNALFCSDAGRRLVNVLYVGWMLNVQVDRQFVLHPQRHRIVFNSLRRIADAMFALRIIFSQSAADWRDASQSSFLGFKPDNLIRKMHLSAAPRMFSNIGRRRGDNAPTKRLAMVMALMGVPPESLGVLVDDFQERHDQNESPYLVLIVPHQTQAITTSHLLLPWRDKHVKYVLDAKLMSSYDVTHAGSGHVVAGVKCSGRRVYVDSNGESGLYDWRASKHSFHTSTLNFSSHKSSQVAILYNQALLQHLRKTAVGIVDKLSVGNNVSSSRVRAACRKAYAHAFRAVRGLYRGVSRNVGDDDDAEQESGNSS